MSEIEEKKFIDELQELTHDVVSVFQQLDREEKSRFGVTMTQSYTLQSIQANEKMTMNQLSDKMKLATSTMTRIVDNLVRDGYIERIRDDTDRRLVYVTLTPDGRKLSGELLGCTLACFTTIVNNISPQERQAVLSGIRVFLEALKCTYAETCEFCESEDTTAKKKVAT